MRLPWWVPFGQVPEIEAAELFRRLGAGERLQLVDVRSDREFAHAHIEGATHLSITKFKAEWSTLSLDPGVAVVAICLSAHRSIPAVRRLRAAGYQAFQLQGGMFAWRRARLPEVGEKCEAPEA